MSANRSAQGQPHRGRPQVIGTRRLVATVVVFATTSAAALGSPTPEQIQFFETKIRPVLAQHCYQCHSAEALRAGKLKASLLVDSRAGMAKGGESGAAVVPRDKEGVCCSRRSNTTASRCRPRGSCPTG